MNIALELYLIPLRNCPRLTIVMNLRFFTGQPTSTDDCLWDMLCLLRLTFEVFVYEIRSCYTSVKFCMYRFRLVLHELNMQGGAAYFYNGLLMVASFTCARILPLPYYIYKIYSVHNTESLEASGFGKYMLWLSTIILDTLNIIWYHRMINGALKILNSPKVPDTPQVTERLKQG